MYRTLPIPLPALQLGSPASAVVNVGPDAPTEFTTDARWQWFKRWNAAQGGEGFDPVEWREFELYAESLTEERRAIEMENRE